MVATKPEDLKNASSGETISNGDRSLVSPQEQLLRFQVRATLIILDILKIPTEEREVAAHELLDALDQCADVAKYGKINANFESFERIVLLSKQLLTEFRRLNGSGKRLLGNDYYKDNAFEIFPSTIQTLAARARLLRPGTRPAHRPNHSVKNPVVQDFVIELHKIVDKRGGKLTLGMNISSHKPNGTLPAVLAVLHEVLPKIFPPNMPYQTLRRMRRYAIEQLRHLPADDGLSLLEPVSE